MSAFSTRRCCRTLLPLVLAVLLAGCETPLNRLREHRFGNSPAPASASASPQALALAVQLSPDGRSLSRESLQRVNSLLRGQGRLHDQIIGITPFNERGASFAPRLAQALQKNGAPMPAVLPVPDDLQRIELAQEGGWDLEIQSEALVVAGSACRIANPAGWTTHPYHAIGPLGCANRANVARMASDPRDLNRPRTLDSADGQANAAAIERYREGRTRDLIDIDFDN